MVILVSVLPMIASSYIHVFLWKGVAPYQVQHSPEHHGDHLYAEEGGDKVQHNTEHDGDHL